MNTPETDQNIVEIGFDENENPCQFVTAEAEGKTNKEGRMVMKDEIPAMMILLTTIILAVGYSFYKSVKEYQKPNYELCPLCNQKVTINI